MFSKSRLLQMHHPFMSLHLGKCYNIVMQNVVLSRISSLMFTVYQLYSFVNCQPLLIDWLIGDVNGILVISRRPVHFTFISWLSHTTWHFTTNTFFSGNWITSYILVYHWTHWRRTLFKIYLCQPSGRMNGQAGDWTHVRSFDVGNEHVCSFTTINISRMRTRLHEYASRQCLQLYSLV